MERTFFCIDKHGLKVETYDEQIRWQDIVATYIKFDNRGEDTSYYLLIHFYNSHLDNFEVIEYAISGIGISHFDLSFYIEYWRIKTRNEEQ